MSEHVEKIRRAIGLLDEYAAWQFKKTYAADALSALAALESDRLALAERVREACAKVACECTPDTRANYGGKHAPNCLAGDIFGLDLSKLLGEPGP